MSNNEFARGLRERSFLKPAQQVMGSGWSTYDADDLAQELALYYLLRRELGKPEPTEQQIRVKAKWLRDKRWPKHRPQPRIEVDPPGFHGDEIDPDDWLIDTLTPRESDVVCLLAEGYDRRQVREHLGITAENLRTILTSVRRKLKG